MQEQLSSKAICLSPCPALPQRLKLKPKKTKTKKTHQKVGKKTDKRIKTIGWGSWMGFTYAATVRVATNTKGIIATTNNGRSCLNLFMVIYSLNYYGDFYASLPVMDHRDLKAVGQCFVKRLAAPLRSELLPYLQIGLILCNKQ